MDVTVINEKNPTPSPNKGIYVGRPTIWGEPHYPIVLKLTRRDRMWRYLWHLIANPLILNRIDELADCDLICYCAPKACHGHILIQLANSPELTQRLIAFSQKKLSHDDCYIRHNPEFTQADKALLDELMEPIDALIAAHKAKFPKERRP